MPANALNRHHRRINYLSILFILIVLPGVFWQRAAQANHECVNKPDTCINACGINQPNYGGEITGDSMQVKFLPDNLVITAPGDYTQGRVIFSKTEPFPHGFTCEVPANRNPGTPYLLVNPAQDQNLRVLLQQNGVALQFQVDGSQWYNYAAGIAIPLKNEIYQNNTPDNPNMHGQLIAQVKQGQMTLGLRLIRQTEYAGKPVNVSDVQFNTLNGATLFYIAPHNNLYDGKNIALNLNGSLAYRVAHCALTVNFSKPVLDFGVMTTAILENKSVQIPFTMTVSKVSACDGHGSYPTDFSLYRLSVSFTSADSAINSHGSMVLRANNNQNKPLNLQLSIKDKDDSRQLKFGYSYDQLGYGPYNGPVLGFDQQKTVGYIAEINREDTTQPVQTGEFRSIIIATINYY